MPRDRYVLELINLGLALHSMIFQMLLELNLEDVVSFLSQYTEHLKSNQA